MRTRSSSRLQSAIRPRFTPRPRFAARLHSAPLLRASRLLPLLLGALVACGAAPGDREAAPAPPAPAGESGAPPRHTNRLIHEKSPYLLQHAHNPVDWYPWGEEAFARARAEDRPVFVSIGYSTCHWCHVMEKESFENEEIAAILNEHFVAIKVDREERPDIDNVYMGAVQAMTGRGGWPLSAFLTPDGKPFFAGTYFPREDRYGRPGFRTILHKVAEQWRDHRADLIATGERVVTHLAQQSVSRGGAELGVSTLNAAADRLTQSFDAVHGGFGKAPKFPRSHTLAFLLRQWQRTGNAQLLEMVELTLDQMARGGMADHLGGGFHRYSTDARWLVPHFEKMLYDQALLARTYLEAYQITGNENDAAVARGIFTYVLRDLHDARGGFYSAEDADSEGEEGLFYVWRPAEISAVLGEETGTLWNQVYGVTEAGNFEGGASILHLQTPVPEFAAAHGLDAAALERRLGAARQQLLEVRAQRIRPHLDDKVITGWNALMISALAYGAQVLDEPDYLVAAERAAHFLLEAVRADDGSLLRRYRDGEAAYPAYIDDYAFFAGALLDLYETTFEVTYLEHALRLARAMIEHFWDESDGGFMFGGRSGETLVVGTKEIYDGALPSGNSVAALVLLRLGDLTGDPQLGERGRGVLEAFSADIQRAPTGYTQMLVALDFAIGPTLELVIAGEPGAVDTRAMLRAVHSRFLPDMVLALRPEGEPGEAIARLAPFLAGQRAVNGRATAYVCKNYACSLPTQEVATMLELIGAAAGRPRSP